MYELYFSRQSSLFSFVMTPDTYFHISLPLDMVTGEAIIAIIPYRMQLNRKGSMWLKCFTITLETLMNSAEDAQMAIPKKEPRHFLLTSIEK